MQDLFSRVCLGVMSASLAIVAYVQISSHLSHSTVRAASPVVQSKKSERCTAALGEARITLAALEAQIKNIPTMVQEKDVEGNVTVESPNRLYEQLMLQIIQTKAEIEDLATDCGP